MTRDERRRVLVEWNDTGGVVPEVTVCGLFEAQVVRSPEAVAVVCGGDRLTYAELNARANRVARRLVECGVGPEVLVGLCVERSVEMVVGVLAVLKAGGAYVPLDPQYPAARLEFMLADTAVPVVLTQEALVDVLPTHSAVTVLLEDPGLTNVEAGNLGWTSAPDNLAYVIYTSGSTGQPKGVMIQHQGLTNLANYVVERLGTGPDDHFIQFSPLGFDASVWDLFVALCSGACLRVVAASEDVAAVGVVGSADAGPEIITAPPSVLRRVFAESMPHPPRLIVSAGEACTPDLLERVREVGPDAKFINAYGPTEVTVCATMFDASGWGGAHAVGVPIGGPIGNTRVYVLDEWFRPVPVGVRGELFVGGVGVARGYVGRAGLTAERFVPDPFGGGGGRLYRTGDVVRWRGNGNLEFLGRVDDQVKVRGFRVELGEVESALSGLPGVGESVVVVREDVPGDPRLVGYVVPDGSGAEPPVGDVAGQYVGEWREVFENLHPDSVVPEDPRFHVAGWDSSYTGEAISAEEMAEWVSASVDRVRGGGSGRVLDIGCGTGLILWRLVEGCAEYVGTDFSASTVARLAGSVEEAGLEGVRVLHREAVDFSGFEAGYFDTVVLNSVVSHFPDADYLLRVLSGAVRVTRPGGVVFVGDVRGLDLLESFQASVAVARAGSETGVTDLLRQIRREVADESELVLDPEFFSASVGEMAGVGHVQVMPRRGRAANEMSCFRYDVLISVGDAADVVVPGVWRDWDGDGLAVDRVVAELVSDRPDVLAVRNIPNARVSSALKMWSAIRDTAAEEGTVSLQDLRGIQAEGVDPEDLWSIGNEVPYDITLCWSQSVAGAVDMVASRRRTELAPHAGESWRWLTTTDQTTTGRMPGDRVLANSPVEARWRQDRDRRLPQVLRGGLRELLPDYMVPSVFVVMDSLPLTSNGKVDRRGLPVPDGERPVLEVGFVAPRGPVEEKVCGIWQDVLGVDRVGVEDDFFDLGGHSLLATQVIARVRATFKINLQVQALFDNTTIASLAAVVDAEQAVRATKILKMLEAAERLD
ncbi:amino acid adenylation domain-containing protein [Kribbella sp. WER1]